MNLLTILLVFFSLANVNHDIQVATFTIYDNSDRLYLEVHIDAEDLSDELGVRADVISPELLEEYLNANVVFVFNGSRNLLSISDIESENGHLVIQSSFSRNERTLATLKISNTCLLSVEDQSNIVSLRFGDVEKDFLMNSSRTTLEINL